MPNGYTAAIYEGKDCSLRDFLMGVARGRGFAIMQRDDDPAAPVKLTEPDTRYHDDLIAEAQALLAELDGMSLADAQARAREEHEAAQAAWTERKHKLEEMRSRYEAMIAEVEAWPAPALLQSMKDDALKMLHESLSFDVGDPGQEMRYYPFPRRQSGADWLNEKREKARRDIDYHREEIRKEIERSEERNRYIQALYDSLPAEVAE